MTKKLLPPEEYYQQLPKKPIGAGVLLFDAEGRLLIVKPKHKDGWQLPGGTVEANEYLREAAIRETKEEIGLEVTDLSLVCVDYVSGKDNGKGSVQFVFYGGVLSLEQIAQITLEMDEIEEFRFAEIAELDSSLRERTKRRMPFCLEAIKKGTIAYLES